MGFSDTLGVGAPAEARRKEDAAASDYLEADYLWLDYLDASYRGNPPYYTNFADITSGKVHAADAGIETAIGCHTFRATGITDYLTNGGRIEVAQKMAGHSNAKTTGLYDRRNDDISVGEVERIGI